MVQASGPQHMSVLSRVGGWCVMLPQSQACLFGAVGLVCYGLFVGWCHRLRQRLLESSLAFEALAVSTFRGTGHVVEPHAGEQDAEQEDTNNFEGVLQDECGGIEGTQTIEVTVHAQESANPSRHGRCSAWERRRLEQAVAWIADGQVDLSESRARCPALLGLLEELLSNLRGPWAQSFRSGKDQMIGNVMRALDAIDPEGEILHSRVINFFLCLQASGGFAGAVLSSVGPHIASFLRGATTGSRNTTSGLFKPQVGGLADLEIAVKTALEKPYDGDGARDVWPLRAPMMELATYGL